MGRYQPLSERPFWPFFGPFELLFSSLIFDGISTVRSVELYAADGKLLHAQEVNAIGTRLSLEGLPAGVYFVRVRTSAGVTTKRLVVE